MDDLDICRDRLRAGTLILSDLQAHTDAHPEYMRSRDAVISAMHGVFHPAQEDPGLIARLVDDDTRLEVFRRVVAMAGVVRFDEDDNLDWASDAVGDTRPKSYEEQEVWTEAFRVLADAGYILDDMFASQVFSINMFATYSLEAAGWFPGQEAMDSMAGMDFEGFIVLEYFLEKGAPLPEEHIRAARDYLAEMSPIVIRRLLEGGHDISDSAVQSLTPACYQVYLEWRARKDEAAVAWDATVGVLESVDQIRREKHALEIGSEVAEAIADFVSHGNPKKRRRYQ